MKTISYILFVLIILFGCIESSNVKTIRIEDGYAEFENPNDSTQIQRILDRNKKLKTEKTIVHDKLVGVYKDYYINGQVEVEFFYVNGVKHGPAKWFYEDGTLFRKATIKHGKFDGELTKYYPDGKKQSVSIYKNGKLMPGLIEFDRTGNIIHHIEKIVFTEIDKIALDDLLRVKISVNTNTKRVKFYEVLGDDLMIPLKVSNGISYKDYHAYRGNKIAEKLTIKAVVATKLGNSIDIYGEHTVLIDRSN